MPEEQSTTQILSSQLKYAQDQIAALIAERESSMPHCRILGRGRHQLRESYQSPGELRSESMSSRHPSETAIISTSSPSCGRPRPRPRRCVSSGVTPKTAATRPTATRPTRRPSRRSWRSSRPKWTMRSTSTGMAPPRQPGRPQGPLAGPSTDWKCAARNPPVAAGKSGTKAPTARSSRRRCGPIPSSCSIQRTAR